jgi:putative transposase of IS4/5 family DUF4096
MDLTDEQWKVLEPLIGELPRRADGRGRPWRDSRDVLNGIRWVLRTGAVPAVPDLPPPVPAMGPRWDARTGAGSVGPGPQGARQTRPVRVFYRRHLRGGEKGGGCVGPTKRGKETKLMGKARQWQTALVFLSPSVPPRLRLTR